MVDDSEFLSRLISFGLSEKEAQLYHHLLKYGPKPPTLLAKSLKTYREDVHRTLTGLIDKGIVKPSIETPTIYMAVDLDVALDVVLKKHESELNEMEMRRRELQELSEQQHFRPSDEFYTFRTIKNIKEAILIVKKMNNSAVNDIAFVLPTLGLAVSSMYGDHEKVKKMVRRGVRTRGIIDISHAHPAVVREYADLYTDVGWELRHYNEHRVPFFVVIDSRESCSAVNPDAKSLSLNEPVTAFWTDDPSYAERLMSTFEIVWKRSVPAAQRIEELLKEGPP